MTNSSRILRIRNWIISERSVGSSSILECFYIEKEKIRHFQPLQLEGLDLPHLVVDDRKVSSIIQSRTLNLILQKYHKYQNRRSTVSTFDDSAVCVFRKSENFSGDEFLLGQLFTCVCLSDKEIFEVSFPESARLPTSLALYAHCVVGPYLLLEFS